VFATNIDVVKSEDAQARQGVTMAILRALGLVA
jgi:beta-lactamase class D